MAIGAVFVVGSAVASIVVVWRKVGGGPSVGDVAIVLLVLLVAATMSMSFRQRHVPDHSHRTGRTVPVDYYDTDAKGVPTEVSNDMVAIAFQATELPIHWSSFNDALRNGVVNARLGQANPILVEATIRCKGGVIEGVVLRVKGEDLRGVGRMDTPLHQPSFDPLDAGVHETSANVGDLTTSASKTVYFLINKSSVGAWSKVELSWFIETKGSRIIMSDTFVTRMG